MKATLDEAIRRVERQDAYLVASAVLLEDDSNLHVAIGKVIATPRRRNPFHWAKEGREARERMIECIIANGICGHVAVHHPTARSGQERARAAVLTALIPVLINEGVDELIIEGRTQRQDQTDQATLVAALSGRPSGILTYSWGTKADRRLWLADALCGAASTYLDGSDPKWFDELREGGVVKEPLYLGGA
jgi:hypothetical protein